MVVVDIANALIIRLDIFWPKVDFFFDKKKTSLDFILSSLTLFNIKRL
jgi:hypothetical protein